MRRMPLEPTRCFSKETQPSDARARSFRLIFGPSMHASDITVFMTTDGDWSSHSTLSAVVKTFKAPELRVLHNVYLNVGEYGKSAFDNIVKMIPTRKKSGGENGDVENVLEEEPVAVLVDPLSGAQAPIMNVEETKTPDLMTDSLEK